MTSKLTHVIKRTGDVVPFTPERISNAIYRAAVAVGGRDRSTAEGLARQVIAILEETTPPGQHPTVEEIQDVVEKVLIENGHARVAKAYILYRDKRARRRREKAGRGYQVPHNIPWRKIYEVLRWSVDHDLHTVDRRCGPRVGSCLRGRRQHGGPIHPEEAGPGPGGDHCRPVVLGQDDDHHQAW
jgi:uridine kinase